MEEAEMAQAGRDGAGEGGVDWMGVGRGCPDEGPRRADALRTLLTPVVLLACAVAAFVLGHAIVGAVLCVLGVGTAALQAALGALFTKYVLRRGANFLRLVAKLTQPGAPHRDPAATAAAPQDDPEARIDEAVGFGLTRAAAAGGFFCAGMPQEAVQARRENVLAEREATYAWLQEGPGWREVRAQGPDGAELAAHAWVADAASGRWAVLCHGYAGTWDSMLQYARHWAQAGFNLLLPSMRCHGGSGGNLIGMGYLDGGDVAAWARRLEEGLFEDAAPACDVVLMGHSMGGHAVLVASSRDDLPACVRAVVADCAFDRAWTAFASMLDAAGLPVHPTLEIARRHVRLLPGGYDIAADDARRCVAAARVPVLLVHGLIDSSVDPSCARRLYEAAQGRAEVLLVACAGHCQSSLVAPKAYWSSVLGFARAHLR